jgi:4-aminobutyrate aminotransferase-like enzyme
MLGLWVIACATGLKRIAAKISHHRRRARHGLMQGMELVGEFQETRQRKHLKRVMELTKYNGLLLGKGGTYGNVLRVAPSLNVEQR